MKLMKHLKVLKKKKQEESLEKEEDMSTSSEDGSENTVLDDEIRQCQMRSGKVRIKSAL